MIYIKIGTHYFNKSKIIRINTKIIRNVGYVLDILYVHPHVQYSANGGTYYLSTINFRINYHDTELLKMDCHKILDNNSHCEIDNSIEELTNEINKIISKNNKLHNNE